MVTQKRFFPFGPKEMDYLSGKDKKMAALIARMGPIKRPMEDELFPALLSSIAAQQVSGKAAATVWGRFCALFPGTTPEAVASAEVETIAGCGMSRRKADYIRGVARAVQSGELDLEAAAGMPDDELITRLSSLRGVGVWTAEMLLIFALGRPNILSWGDFGIRKGLMRLHGHRELGRERFERYRKRYSPYGSVASLYLWELAGQAEEPVAQ